MPTKTQEKPMLRGHFHQAAFFLALGACSMLIAESRGSRAFAANLIYSFSICGLLGVSALYHRPRWNPHWRMWMRRLDHAAIFVLIAGTSTPIAVVGMPKPAGNQFLLLIWIAAALGVLLSVFLVKAPKWVSASVAVAAGMLAIPYLPAIASFLGNAGVIKIVLGGGIYVLGAAVYALKKPNPYPKYFGYHEIFHILVVIAAFFHFLVIRNLAQSA